MAEPATVPAAGPAIGATTVPATIPALLAERRRDLGPVAAIVSDDEVLTYDDLDARSHARARQLAAAGVDVGTRVGLLMPNGIGWAVTAYAVMRIGGVLVPLSTLLRPPELASQLAVAGVAVLVAEPEVRGRRHLRELDEHVPGITAVGRATARHPRLPDLREVWAADALPERRADPALVGGLEGRVRPASDLAILFTSGSRGRPKGVIHTHGGAIRATAAGLSARGIGEGDRLYIPMPFFWMGGFGTGLLSTLIAGATLLTESDPTPAGTIRFLERQRATLFRGWPDQAARLAADPSFAGADLGSLRVGSLDAVLPAALRAEPGARANLLGMTESFGPYCGFPLDTDLPEGEWGTCGQPLEGTEVRITDVDTGQPVAQGVPGHIELRGPNLMRGIRGRLRQDDVDVAGWFVTGDLGRLDAAGFLTYEGRADDMFKVSGATVYPTEVEAALRAIPSVRQAYVTDLDAPGGGRAVGALVVLAEDVSLAEVATQARARLSSFKVPTRWLAAASVAAVPKSATGKVDKGRLQARLASDGQEVSRR